MEVVNLPWRNFRPCVRSTANCSSGAENKANLLGAFWRRGAKFYVVWLVGIEEHVEYWDMTVRKHHG